MLKQPVINTCLFIVFLITMTFGTSLAENAPISESTESCIECHELLHPGIVEEWKQSAHYRTTPAQGLKKKPVERLISADKIPEAFAEHSVGCAECHTINPDKHKDTFDHNDYQIHTVVSPKDCALCHPTEADQYDGNLMSHAFGNLQKNSVYRSLADSINGTDSFDGTKLTHKSPDTLTEADSCLFCHGTSIRIDGTRTVQTDEGEMSFPKLSGWPNQGVGRINPDGSRGSCSACHPRHKFDLQTARKPETCSECHKGPDVPAYSVYKVSKHGNIYSSGNESWNFKATPWTVGKDFTAPTCATCHISLVTTKEGDVITRRSHRMNDRLPWRIFGLIYAHAHPKSPDTTIIRNKAGLPLPSELTGESAEGFLIDRQEQETRQKSMEKICLACHSSGWTEGHFIRLENTLKTTNEMTLAATKILASAWDKGFARGLAHGDSIFNEAIEKKWVEQWLFYANSTRFASAMAGADYGAFANGRYHLSKNLKEMSEWLEIQALLRK